MLEQLPLDYYETEENDHGRRSAWSVTVYNGLLSSKTAEWEKLHRFIHVHKITTIGEEQTHSDRLYISSHFESSAKFYHEGIRGHWTIENSLHWVKDVLHGEDGNQIKKDNGPVNSAVFSSIAINLHRKNGQHSISDGQMKNSSNVKELFSILNQAI
jgi:predicted transposase YbfD/YdcC